MFNCYVHQQKFNQYALEVHFAFKHTNFQNNNPNKCDIYDNCIENNINFSQHIKNVHDVIFELIVWTKRSNYKCVPTPVTFTKLTNITNVENYLHILVI